jgi:hypothetical protein
MDHGYRLVGWADGHGLTRVSSDSDSASDSACGPGDERGDGSGVAAAS